MTTKEHQTLDEETSNEETSNEEISTKETSTKVVQQYDNEEQSSSNDEEESSENSSNDTSKETKISKFLNNISNQDIRFMRDLMEGGCEANQLHDFVELKYKMINLMNNNYSKEDIIYQLNMNSDIYEIINSYC